MRKSVGGYAGRILHVDLAHRRCHAERWSPEDMRLYVGGAGLGASILYRTLRRTRRSRIAWDDPRNPLVLATGPLAGLPVWGTGALSVVTIGAGTNGPTSSQANGFFGANLKYAGYDAIVVVGQARDWIYLYVSDDAVELRDARHLAGMDTWQTQHALAAELGLKGHALSVYSIGPAGEQLVRFAVIQGDYGHVASKNGCGAVMGSKRLKAVAIVRGSQPLRVADPYALERACEEIAHELRSDPSTSSLYTWGTLPGIVSLYRTGALPIKNYTTNVTSEDLARWQPPALRAGFDHRGHQCSACGMRHCQMVTIREGEHRGRVVDEPEYEGWAGVGWQIGLTDRDAIAWLNTECDKIGVDVNEFGWICGWIMECQERGYIGESQLGFKLCWGDAAGARRLLQMIAHLEGIGAILADGVKRAADRLGDPARKCAIFILSGTTPRGHDHRAKWEEMLDTCTSATGTLETGSPVQPTELGLPARIDPFDPIAVADRVAGLRGRRHFEDSLGICAFTTRTRLELVCRALSAATGWDYRVPDALRLGDRTSALLRATAVACGITPGVERPSARYGSTPVDGPAKGIGVADHWDRMVSRWYSAVGYDRNTGKPLAKTLRALGLDAVADDLWD